MNEFTKHKATTMRATFAQLMNSIQLSLGLINRVVNTADALVESVEVQAVAYRDEEVLRIANATAEAKESADKA